ncbi:MAG: GntR family transcriptional regulator [Bryobacteraceae bacterium]|nr:GntR family transcriptional regulator [Bryobacteraceae bacterium]
MLTERFQLSQPVRQESLSSQVYGILKDAVFTGKFKPGETLRELHLAKMFDVSQATIREALVQLEHAGLVIRLQNRKTTVTSLTPEDVRDRLEMRIVLEDLAFRKAAARMSGKDLADLRELSDAIQSAIDAGSYPETTAADMRFHHFVWEKSGSPALEKNLDQLTTPLFAFLGVLHAHGMADLRVTKSHEKLVEALASRDDATISAAVKEHITGSYGAFLQSGVKSLEALAPVETAGA